MAYEYKVEAFTPVIRGCGAQDMGWDLERCRQFQDFLNSKVTTGWKLHSSEYRQVTGAGCGNNKGAHLVCIFERQV